MPTLLGALLLILTAGSACADTVFLKDGRILKGRVIDKGDTIFIAQRFGGLTVERQNVIRIELDKGVDKASRDFDELVLKDGKIVQGDVRMSADGTEVVVSLGERGEVRHPRTAVDRIHWRDGREEKAAPSEERAEDIELRKKILRLVDDLARIGKEGKPDLGVRGAARRELMALGVFARGHLDALEGERKKRVEGILQDLDRLEGIRRVMPGVIETKHPRIAERLIARDEADREAGVRAAVMEAPHKIGPLLLHLVKNDSSPRVRAFCVSQLSALRKFEELAEVLRIGPSGPLRLAAAFALGDAGIYAGVPILIDALRLSDLQIRSAAVHKLREYTKQHFGFRPNAPEEERTKAIDKWTRWWDENGRDIVRRGIKEVAPTLEGARLTEAERKEANRLWGQAAAIIAADQASAEAGELKRVETRQRKMSLERALDLLRRALDLDPSLSSARMTRAVLLYEEFDRMDMAAQERSRILDRGEHDQGDADEARKFAHYHLGRIALLEKAYRKATLSFSQALQADEDFLDALSGQADAYLGMALSDRPGEALEPATRLKALDSANVAFQRALTAMEAQDRGLVKMIEELQGKGTKTLEEGQVIQAVRRSRRAIDKQKAAVHFKIGRLEAARQRDEKALEHYRIASRLDPKNKDYARALEFWEKLRSPNAE
jgi:tetratricopeptide (TPR) repeat protein